MITPRYQSNTTSQSVMLTYVPDYNCDIFVSYAAIDNQPLAYEYYIQIDNLATDLVKKLKELKKEIELNGKQIEADILEGNKGLQPPLVATGITSRTHLAIPV